LVYRWHFLTSKVVLTSKTPEFHGVIVFVYLMRKTCGLYQPTGSMSSIF
jgi:hypothetical protein